jgi:hypothetical protein
MREMLDQILQSTGEYVPTLIGALAILVIGWLVALILSSVIRSLLMRSNLNTKLASWSGETQTGKTPDVAKGIGKAAFWIIMVLVLIAFFQVLGITLATDPLTGFLGEVFGFIPKIIGAVLLLLIAWILASVLRLIITRALGAAKFDERIKAGAAESERVPLTRTMADAAYWLVLLLFLPAILGTLGLDGLLKPVQSMLDKFLGFLPNLLAATLIGLVGWFVARIVQRIVTNLITATGADKLSGRVGLKSLPKIVGLVVYILILIPVIVAALNALALDAVTYPASSMLNQILASLPAIFAAAVVIALAYVIAKLLAGFVTELLTGIGFNTILVRLGIAADGQEPKKGATTPSEVVGYLVLVTIMLIAIFEASGLLGFEALSMLTAELTVFGGHIFLGLMILMVGLFLANVAAKAVRSSGSAQAGILATVTRVAILLLAGAMAIRQMGLANEIINIAFGMILGSIAVAFAIAFGIGGRDLAAKKLQKWSDENKK